MRHTLRVAAFALLLASVPGVRARAGLSPAPPGEMRGGSDAPGDSVASAPTIHAVRIEGAITIDGVDDEEAWLAAVPTTTFTQRQPDEGKPASQRTEVRVVYDEVAVYISARLYDSDPGAIVARLGRRDADTESDHFVVFLDPYNDDRSGYYFGINAAGTLYDGVMMNDDWDDEDWDGVWEGKARVNETGWCAELKIPFSQLRFHRAKAYVWGVNFRRGISRRNEIAYVVYTPRDESGFVSRFPDLLGIGGISPRRQIEVVPYVTARAEYLAREEGDPFNDGSRLVPTAGADLKMGVASNLTLNATVNPDFGQVEVDPAVVNLSDVETFFPEKRPFFIEGSTIFDDFGRGGANDNWGFNWGNPSFFYSRRVGRSPQGSLPEHDFAESRDGTRILGASKLVGRLGGGWNLGTIHAVTERHIAEYERGGERRRAEVEPLSYYGVIRGQKEINDGRQAAGLMTTLAARDLREARLADELNRSALSVAADGWTFLDRDKAWVLTGWAGVTRVTGTAHRITDLQRSPLHYFQRPDADYVTVDSTATALTGTAGRLMLNKQRGRFSTNAAVGFISPSFDVNDLGYLWQAGMVNAHFVAGYQWTTPSSWYRSIYTRAAAFNTWDFDGNSTWRGLWARTDLEFLNYHQIEASVAYNPQTVNNRRTRGGPLTLNPPGGQLGLEYGTDDRKRLYFELRLETYRQRESDNRSASLEAVWQASPNVSLSVEPEMELNHEFAQWVGAFDDPTATRTFGRRYVFAELDQTTVAANIRLNWTFTPELSLQIFAQPLVSSGDYENFKELRAPRTYDFLRYGTEGSSFDEETLTADPDGVGPAPPIVLENPDFNFRSLRGTAVMRWEYRPGSTLYLVWTQTRSAEETIGDFRFGDSLGGLFDAKPDNIFMVKLTYWLSR